MPLYQTVAYTTTGTKASINTDPSIAPFNTTVAVTIGNAGSYTLQYSLSGPDVADADALWFNSVNMPSGTTTSAVSSFISPVSRLRLIIASVTGTITLQVSQGFSKN